MKKVTYGLIIITIILFLGPFFVQNPLLANTENEIELGEKENKEILLNITTVSKNQYYMIKSIVQDKHNVEYLFENENEINEFKYSEDIINHISERDLFIYSGINNEQWIDEFIGNLEKGNLGIINMSRGIKTLINDGDGNKENPYYWLGINEYKIALYNIKSAIQEKDPKNKSYYEENYDKCISEIEEYVKLVNLKLDKYKGYTILTNTNTFDYLFRDFGLQVVKIDEKITKEKLERKNLSESKVIFVTEKNSIESNEENKIIEEKEIDTKSEEILEVKSIELIRWDSNKTLVELILSNINLVIDTFEEIYIVE